MTNAFREVHWLAWSSIVTGVATLTLAIAALAFPEPMLIGAMLGVGLLSTLVGLNHIFTATSIRAGAAHWRLAAGHGALLLSYGLLTVGGTAVAFALTLTLVAVWLVAHMLFAIRIATTIPTKRWIRSSLYASAVLDISIVILIAVGRPLTIFQFLYFGAAYAVVFGASQIVGGVVMNRIRGHGRTASFAWPLEGPRDPESAAPKPE